MASCMVTCGRGLDDFVWHEILEKVPGAVDLRHLGEGKLAFKVSPAVETTDTASTASHDCASDKGSLDDEGGNEERREHCVTSTSLKKLIGTKDMIQKQEAASQRATEPPGTSTEEVDQWVSAVSHIFKLRLVERVFALLHCEDIGSGNECHASAGNSRVDDILREYENKIKSLIETVKWNDLAAKLQRVKDHQNGERSRLVWCQDHDSCPGSLRRRQTKQELKEKRAASVSSERLPESYSKRHWEGKSKTGYHKKVKVHETNDTSDSNLKPTIPNSMCKYESTKVHEALGNSALGNYIVHDGNQFRTETDMRSKSQYSQSSQKDSKNASSSLENPNANENETDVSPAERTMDVMPEERNPQSKVFERNHCPPSQMVLESEEIKIGQDVTESSNAPKSSTFRVSSRVSGPHKHVLTVKWINHILGQQLVKAMPGWVPDWRQPIVDLYVNITASHFIIGAALSSRPLSLRPYIPHLTLRSTISHLMARLSCLPPEAIVLDPMCGGGSILAETATSFDVGHVIASDSSREQLEVTKCNLHSLRVPVTLLQADAQELPLQDSSVNTVLCDFPFGKKHKLTTDSQQLLAEVLRETHRVLVCGGRAVFLLSPRQSEAVSQLACNRTKSSSAIHFDGGNLTLLETHFVSLGETSAYMTILAKEHLPLKSSKEEREGISRHIISNLPSTLSGNI